MYILYAPREKFGLLKPAHDLITPYVRFWQNVAFCPTQYWKKVHIALGCRDISPRYFKKLRLQRDLLNVVLFATGGIGDTMWNMPFARALNEKYPKCKIYVIVDKKSAAVWLGVPYVAMTIDNMFWNVEGLIRNTDEVFDFSGMATMFKKEMRLDPVEATFKMAEWPLPKEKEKCRPRLTVRLDEGNAAIKRLATYGLNQKRDTLVTIGVEASTSNRNWPFNYTKDITEKLLNAGAKVVWLGKSVEYSARILKSEDVPKGVINLIEDTNIRQVMATIALSDLFIGPNSGLMVIATALKIPTVGLFGAFNPKLRCKYYDRFTGVWGRTDCAPCNEHWTECRHGHPPPCMKSIMPSQVYNTAKEMLKMHPRHILEKLPLE